MLNYERHVGALGSAWQFYDVLWDPLDRQFVFVVLTGGETALIPKAELMSPVPVQARRC